MRYNKNVTHRFPALIAAPPAARGRLWLTGARLFDGTGGPLREDSAVLIEDGIIRRVADDRERCPDGARPVDLGQRTLMPGLTDAHTHASGRVPHPAKGAEAPLPEVAAHFLQAELRDYLSLGVTTIRVCGSHRARHVPEPPPGPAGGDGRRGPVPGAHAVGLLLDGRPGRDRRPGGRPDAAAADPDAPHADPGMPPVLTELAHHNLAEGAASMRAAQRAGVKIALGSDMSLATGLEIERMVEHGLTPAQALAAATGTAAAALGLGDRLGTVTEGKLADLIVVDGDPLASPALLSGPGRIWLVLQQGVPVAGDGQWTERPS